MMNTLIRTTCNAVSLTTLTLLLQDYTMWKPFRTTAIILAVFCCFWKVSASNKPPPGAAAATTSRPPFLSHITPEELKEALRLGSELHNKAVQTALQNYPIDLSLPPDADVLHSIRLQNYKIDAPSVLPDFSEELRREIFVTHRETPLLTTDECRHVIQNAEDYFSKTTVDGQWTLLPSGQYMVAGFWIKSIPEVQEWFLRTVRTRLFPLLAQTFPDFCTSPDDLCVDNTYLFKYTTETGRRTDIHTDSGCLSFTIALNSNDDYVGGGTWFEGLQQEGRSDDDDTRNNNNNVIEMNTGQVTIRPGGVKHCGHAVHSGVRYVIGGFCMNKRKAEHVRQLLANSGDNNSDSSDSAAADAGRLSRTKMLEAAVALNPALEVGYNLLADRYEKDGDSEKARQVLEYSLQNIHPLSGPVAYALGSLYRQAGEHDKAMDCFLTCLEADADDIDAMLAIAGVASDMGNAALEREYCEKVLATPGAAPKIAAQACCNLGVLHQGDDKEIDYYAQAISLYPEAFPPCYSLACALAERQQWQASVDAFRQALAMAADNAVAVPEQDRILALQSLYKAAMNLIQSQRQRLSSQAEMVERFQQVMGEDNYKDLAASRGQ
jgi:tetratricopeptide (TPR) repeat protein